MAPTQVRSVARRVGTIVVVLLVLLACLTYFNNVRMDKFAVDAAGSVDCGALTPAGAALVPACSGQVCIDGTCFTVGCFNRAGVLAAMTPFALLAPSAAPPGVVPMTPSTPAAVNDLWSLGASAPVTYTVSARLVVDSISGSWRNVFTYGRDDGDRTPALYIWPGSTHAHFRHASTTNWNDGISEVGTPSTLGTPFHLTVTVDRGRMDAYVDGVPAGTAAATFTWGQPASSKQLLRNTYNASGVQATDIFMLPVALSAAEAATLHATLYGAGTAGPGFPNCDALLGKRRSPAPAAGTGGGASGRYVVISTDVSPEHILNVAEIQVFDENKVNVSQGKTVTKSSGWQGDQFPGANLVDGNTNNFAHTSGNAGESPWMSIDLGADTNVSLIKVFNRTDCCQGRLAGALVQVLDSLGGVVFTSPPLTAAMEQDVVPAAGSRLPPAARAAPAGGGVNVLGPWNMGPWGVRTFADKGAVWIWNEAGAASNAAVGVCIDFNTVVTVEVATDVTFHIIADDRSDLRVNGRLVGDANGGWGGGYAQLTTLLTPGRNVVQIQVQNGGGPAGLLATIVDSSGTVIAHTDGSWKWSGTCD